MDRKARCDWETVYYALLDSAERGSEWVDVFDGVRVRMFPWAYGELDDDDLDEYIMSDYCMCCEDDDEFTAEAASSILGKYQRLMEDLFRRTRLATGDHIFDACCWADAEPFWDEVTSNGDERERAVLQNCIWGWEGFQYDLQTILDNEWNYGLNVERTKQLWKLAYWYVAEGCMLVDAA